MSIHSWAEAQLMETDAEITQLSELINKICEAVIVNVLTGQKGNMFIMNKTLLEK